MRPLKRIVVGPLCFLLALTAFALLPSPKTVILAFEYPTNQVSDSLTFYLYATNNVSVPLTNWPAVGSLSATNATTRIVSGTNWTYTITNVQAYEQTFYVVRASNALWGVASDFSGVAAEEPLPRSDVQISIKRGD